MSKRDNIILSKSQEICDRFESLDDLKAYISKLQRIIIKNSRSFRAIFLMDLQLECQDILMNRLNSKGFFLNHE
ncbi:hypothetical protein MYP_690 [Sporocytophaga myxococcoides]|uniref:Uncharacterized protein n=1 Tax=Sporocytophaga myxococcoides TaxID=153721 RepID=A0A098LBA0_9BACT|nr:hypothetical protein MYP_690 [Sporocytophaga myxococcoides]